MRAVLIFFAASYVLTWSAWFAASGTQADALRTALVLVGTFVPGLVALGLAAKELGRDGVTDLMRRLVRWRVPARWYLFATSYIALVKLSVAVVYRFATGAWPAFSPEPLHSMLAATLASTLVGGQVGEELGWRGYAFPRLAAWFGAGPASVILGALWACWHLPLFFLLGADTVGQSFPLYLLQVTALSVAMCWLYLRTGGSLLLVMLLHAAVNNTKDIVPSAEAGATDAWALSHSPVAWMTVVVLWLCATYFLFSMRANPGLLSTIAPREPVPR